MSPSPSPEKLKRILWVFLYFFFQKKKNCQMYGSRASLGPPRPRRSVASGSHQVAEVAIRHW